MRPVQRAACIGGGVIGAGWIARLLHNGIDVAVSDPDPGAPEKFRAVVDQADRALSRLTAQQRPVQGTLTIAASIGEAAEYAELVIEAVPERIEVKQAVYAEIEDTAATDALITSSTSGIRPSDLQDGMRHPGRFLVAHPFNPVYLLPLVELVGGGLTAPDAIDRAAAIFESVGMKPLHVRKEIDAFIADRLMEAVWREALWLVKDGVATTGEIDDAIRYGFGLRWAQMGLFETFRVAGGEAGMRHFLKQFGPCLQWPWSRLTDVPDFNDELVDLIAGQSDAQSGHHSIRELEQIRDDNLVDIMRALKANTWGAGEVLADYESRLSRASADKVADTVEET